MQIYSIQEEDKTELEKHVPKAQETCWFYDQLYFSTHDIEEKTEAAFSKVLLGTYYGQNHMIFIHLIAPFSYVVHD